MDALNFISGVGSVARKYGVEEAILLDSMVFWWRSNRAEGRNLRDGRYWSYHSVRGLTEIFPWWTAKQIRRILTSCTDQGALITGNYNAKSRDRTIWYTPGDDLLELYGYAEMGKCNCPNGQMELPKRANAIAQMGEPLPCITPCSTSVDPPLNPPQGERRASKYDLAEDAKPMLREYCGDDNEMARALADLIEVRREKKAINSKRGIKALLAELDRLSDGHRDIKLLLLRQSIANSWKSVFPLRQGNAPPPGGGLIEEEGVYLLE